MKPSITKPTTERIHTSLWWCEACKDGADLTPEQMTDHLLTKHGINICRTPYQRNSFPPRKENGKLIETYELVVDGGKIVLTNEQVFYTTKAKV